MPKLTDKTLGDACANGDGSYNGVKALQWLHEALTGKSMSEDEVQRLWQEAKEKRRVRSSGDA